MRRFYSPPETFNDKHVVLDLEQTRHLRDVLRLREGENVQLFDGAGREFLCRIERLEKRQTTLKIIEEISPKSSESHLDLTLAVAFLKGEKIDLVIQKAVELGVTRFVPIETKRADVKLKNAERKLERWRKIIVEASKQTGRAMLMQIEDPMKFKEFVESAVGTKILFSERDGKSFDSIKSAKKITAIIGSEGGWEDSEIDFARDKDFQIITFGGRILRAETAAITIASVLQNRFGDLN